MKKVLILIVLVISLSLFATAYAETNIVPNVNTVITAAQSGGSDISNFSVNSGGLSRLYVRGVASDGNGCLDIDNPANWDIVFYRSGAIGGPGCTADNNDCYVASGVTFSGCTGAQDQDIEYEAHVDIQYYADPTDAGSPYEAENWVAFVQVTDEGTPFLIANNSDTFEMNGIFALDVTADVNYGALDLGDLSLQQSVSFENIGNRKIDVDISTNGDMVCSALGNPTIPAGNVHISTVNGFVFGVNDQPLTISPSFFDLNLDPRTDDLNPSTKDSYLRLQVPSFGIEGSCVNIVTFTAIANS